MKLEAIFKAYFVRLCAFAINFVHDEDVAKDMVQEAFIVLSQQQDVLNKPELVIKSFLYSTVKNISLKQVRKNQKIIKIQEDENHDIVDNTDYLAQLIKSEIIGELMNEMSGLPEKSQHICKLLFLEEKSYQEVADELNISINTVKTQRQRALVYLRTRIFKEFLIFILLKITLIYS